MKTGIMPFDRPDEPVDATRELVFSVKRELNREEQFDVQDLINNKLMKGVKSVETKTEDGETRIQVIFKAKGALDLDEEADRYALSKELGSEVEVVEDNILN